LDVPVLSTDLTLSIVHNYESDESSVTMLWVRAAEVTDLVEVAWNRLGQFCRAELSQPDMSSPVAIAFAVRATGLLSGVFLEPAALRVRCAKNG
jgi:hypothetical protein